MCQQIGIEVFSPLPPPQKEEEEEVVLATSWLSTWAFMT
jgi:hypothetical protein